MYCQGILRRETVTTGPAGQAGRTVKIHGRLRRTLENVTLKGTNGYSITPEFSAQN